MHGELLTELTLYHDFEELTTSTSENGVTGAPGADPAPEYTSVFVVFVIFSMAAIFSMLFDILIAARRPHEHIYDVTNLMLIF